MRKLIGHERVRSVPVERSKSFGVAIAAEVHDPRADHRQLRSPRFLDDGHNCRLHVFSFTAIADRPKTPLPDLATNATFDLDDLAAASAGQVLVLETVGTANSQHLGNYGGWTNP
ncbi:MAG: hypothetical protein HKO76_11500 [Acidimicrobiia bacterium]|nr:hypothetical protein [Acidimicrobiia bacterium]